MCRNRNLGQAGFRGGPPGRRGIFRWHSQGCAPLALGYSRFAPPGRLSCGLHALDETLGEAKAGSQETLAAGHQAGVGFVVVAGEVEQAVENQHLDLGGEGMALFEGLTERGGDRDGQVAGDFFGANAIGGEGKHVGGLVFTAELAVEAADGEVGGELHGDFALEADGGLGQGQKTGQGAGGGQAEILFRDCRMRGRQLLRRSFLGRGVGVQIWVEEDHLARRRNARGSVHLQFYATVRLEPRWFAWVEQDALTPEAE